MPPLQKSTSSRIKVHDMPESTIKGGTDVPLEFPHLYRIHAGDWRISYAVEHNRLAILVLEVLTAEESEREDTARQEMSKILKIRLLNSTNEHAQVGTEPAVAGKKSRIKVLDVSPKDDASDPGIGDAIGKPRIRVLEVADNPDDGMDPNTDINPAKPRVRILEISEPVDDEQGSEADPNKKSRIRLLEISEEVLASDADSEADVPKSRIKVLD